MSHILLTKHELSCFSNACQWPHVHIVAMNHIIKCLFSTCSLLLWCVCVCVCVCVCACISGVFWIWTHPFYLQQFIWLHDCTKSRWCSWLYWIAGNFEGKILTNSTISLSFDKMKFAYHFYSLCARSLTCVYNLPISNVCNFQKYQLYSKMTRFLCQGS